MNKITIATVFAFFIASLTLYGQQANSPEPLVKTAAYSDKTPPLRDMKIVVAGSRDRSWKDGLVGNRSKDESFLWENRSQVDADAARQKKMGTRGVDGPVQSFPGIGKANSTPPDTDGDVGLNHYFQMVNLSFAIWDKQGNLLYGPADNITLWDGFIGPWTGTNDGDPIVLYDDYADRWVATQFAVETNNGTYWQLIAISETGDPLGSYYRYAFEFDNFNDYPKFSIWPDGYYSTYNIFDNDFVGAVAAVMDRDAMLVGDPDARMVMFGPYPEQYGLKSAHLDGWDLPPANAPNWMVNLQKYGQQKIEVYMFETDWQTPTNSSYTLQNTLPVTAFTFFNPSIREQLPQPNSRQLLDPLSKYLMNPLQYRNFGSHETMLVNHTVRVDTVAGVRWYELRKDAGQDDWYIYQQGTYCPADGLSRWMASIAMNANGDIALGYSITGHTLFPSVAYTGQTAGAPLGEMNVEEVVVIGGTHSQNTSARWGDYSAMAIDPVDDTTFWYTGEYMPSSGWGTRVVSFDFGPIQAPTAYAGPDSEVCFLQVYQALGSVTGQQSVQWTSSGNGNLINATSLTPLYFRGSEDVLNGYFELTLTAYGFGPGMEALDVVHVDIINEVSVDLGNDTLICANQTLQLIPQLVNVDSLHWTTSGDGFFSNDAIAGPFYTPGTQDVLNGEVTLNLYAEAFAPCEGDDEDAMVLTLDPCTNIGELSGKARLNVYPNPSDGIFNVEVSGLPGQAFTLKVINIEGQPVFSGNLYSSNDAYANSINLTYLAGGVYYISIQTEKEHIIKKIVFE